MIVVFHGSDFFVVKSDQKCAICVRKLNGYMFPVENVVLTISRVQNATEEHTISLCRNFGNLALEFS
jgi:hypothetical protein